MTEFIAGLGIGTALGLLFAPAKADIEDVADDFVEHILKKALPLTSSALLRVAIFRSCLAKAFPISPTLPG